MSSACATTHTAPPINSVGADYDSQQQPFELYKGTALFKKLKQSILFKNTFIYTLLQLVNKGIPFLLLPILTRYLNTDDYGMIAAYNTLVNILVIFIGVSVPGVIGVNYFHLKKEHLRQSISNVFIIFIVSTLLVILLLALFQDWFMENSKLPIMWLFIAIAVAMAQNFTSINLILWRSEQRARSFALYEILETIFNISVSLLLVIFLKYGWEGRLEGTASASIVFGLLSILIIYKRGYTKFNYSTRYVKEALRFGIPLLPHQLAIWMRTGVDILLITYILGVSYTGIYSVGYQLGSVVGVVAMAFNNAYSPYLYKNLKNITYKNKIKLVKFTYLYFIGIIVFALGLSMLFEIIMPYFLGTSFQQANQFIVWIALAHAFNGMYMMVVNYIFYVKKTHLLSMTTILTSVVHVLLSYTFIHNYGAIGAAYASVASFFLTFILVWIISSRVFAMPWMGRRKMHV